MARSHAITSVLLLTLVGGSALAEQADPEVSRSYAAWNRVVSQAQQIQSRAVAMVTVADQQLRNARDSAGAYLQRQSEAAPRLRGVHLLAPSAAETEAESGDSTLSWIPLVEAEAETQGDTRVVLLIHGLDEPGRVWDDLAPVLAENGYVVARFDYPNDQAIADSAHLLGDALRDMQRQGISRVDLICHSMGGLVARDVLTNPAHYAGVASAHPELPAVTSLITLGTPHYGSPWAHLQCISDAAEQVDRFIHCPDLDPRHFLGFLADGRGEAARDLLPGSAYLIDLNSRSMPPGLRVTSIVGVIDAVAAADDSDSEVGPESGARILSVERAAQIRRSLSGRLGDGVVSTTSAQLAGVDDVVFVESSHRGMVRRSRIESAVRWTLRSEQDEPPAIPIILDRLEPQRD